MIKPVLWPCPVSTCGGQLERKDHRPRSIAGDPTIHTTLFVCLKCGAQPYSEETLVGFWKKSYLPHFKPAPADGRT
jgi:hypothetical protein